MRAPNPEPRKDITEFRPLRAIPQAVLFGVVTYPGIVYRSVAIEGEPLAEALRTCAPVAGAFAVGLYVLGWTVAAFNRHFPRRPD